MLFILSVYFCIYSRSGNGVRGCEIRIYDRFILRNSSFSGRPLFGILDRRPSFTHTSFMEEKETKIQSFFRSVFGFGNRPSFFSGRLDSSPRLRLFRLNKKGFTLVELLVVIAMIGILTTAAMMLINPSFQLQKARDSKRKSDIKLMQSALELFRSEQGIYPTSLNSSSSLVNCIGSSSFTSDTSGNCNISATVYLQTVPTDPKTNTNYYYCASGESGCAALSGGYVIYSCLENASDTSSKLSGSTTPIAPIAGSSVANFLGCPTGSAYYGVINP